MTSSRAAAGKQPSTILPSPPTTRALPAEDPFQFSCPTGEDVLSGLQSSTVSWNPLQLDDNWLAEPAWQQASLQDAAFLPEQGPSPVPQLSCLPALADLLPAPDSSSLDDGSILLDDSGDLPKALMELLGLPEQLLTLDPAVQPSAFNATAISRANLSSPGSSISSCSPVALPPPGPRLTSPAPAQQLLRGMQLPQQLPLQPLESQVLAVPTQSRQFCHPQSLFAALPPSLGISSHARSPSPMQQAPCLQPPHLDPADFIQGAARSPEPCCSDFLAVQTYDESPNPEPQPHPASRAASFRDEPRRTARRAGSPVRFAGNALVHPMQGGPRLPARLTSFGHGPVSLPVPHASPASAGYGINVRFEAVPSQLAAGQAPQMQADVLGSSQSFLQDCQDSFPQLHHPQPSLWGSTSGTFHAQNSGRDASGIPSSLKPQLAGCARLQSPQLSPIGSTHDMAPSESNPYPTPHKNDWRRLRARLWGDEDCTPEATVDLDSVMVAEPSSSASTLLPVLHPAWSMGNEVPSLQSDAASLESSLPVAPSLSGASLGRQRHSWGAESNYSSYEVAPAIEAHNSPITVAKPRAFLPPRVYTSSSHGHPWHNCDGDLLDMEPLSPPADVRLPTSKDTMGFISSSPGAGDKSPAQLSPQLPVAQGRKRSAQHSMQPMTQHQTQTLASEQLQQQRRHYRPRTFQPAKAQVNGQSAEAPTSLTIKEDPIGHQLLAWSPEGNVILPTLAKPREMQPKAQIQAPVEPIQLQEVPTLDPSPACSAEMVCKVPFRMDRGQKRRQEAIASPDAAVKHDEGIPQRRGEDREPTPGSSAKRGCKGVVTVRQGKSNWHAAMAGQSRASQQLKALEQINKVFQRDKGQSMPELPFSRPERQKIVGQIGGPRTQQLELEKNVEKLIDDVYMLGPKGVSLPERQAATKRTVQAIRDACALCSRPSSQVYFVPHSGVCRVAAECELDAQGVVEGALRCKCNEPVRISHGPLKGIAASEEVLQASETACSETEAAYLPALVSALSAAEGSEGGQTAQQLAVEVSLLFVLRTHMRRSSMIAAQHEGLTTLQSQTRPQSCISNEALAKADLTGAQVQALVAARENYMTRTRRILQQRQALWQMVQGNLLETSLQDGGPSAEGKICAFEKVLELQRNMDDYHWNFAWLMREWCLRILSPPQVATVLASFASSCDNMSQVMACAGFYLLETLGLQADADPALDILAALDIPAPQDFSELPNSKPE